MRRGGRGHSWTPVRRKGKPTGVFRCVVCGARMRDLFAPSAQGGARVRVFDWPDHLMPFVTAEGAAGALPMPMGWTTIRPKCEAPRG